jgi:ectoine hydroxylase-related dioxygenase (phytanoyl-CoA dioxygenase family)
MCGVWVALEDVDVSNGPLEYYPGSHRLPIYTNEHIGRNPPHENIHGNYSLYVKLWAELVRTHGLKREEFHPKKGQALIWSANLLHGGARQLDKERTRWSQVTHYFFEDCCYYTPLTEIPLKSNALRNIVNIQTGLPVKNTLNGETIDETPNRGKLQSLLERLMRWQ